MAAKIGRDGRKKKRIREEQTWHQILADQNRWQRRRISCTEYRRRRGRNRNCIYEVLSVLRLQPIYLSSCKRWGKLAFKPFDGEIRYSRDHRSVTSRTSETSRRRERYRYRTLRLSWCLVEKISDFHPVASEKRRIGKSNGLLKWIEETKVYGKRSDTKRKTFRGI
jgi:hypothetical protein